LLSRLQHTVHTTIVSPVLQGPASIVQSFPGNRTRPARTQHRTVFRPAPWSYQLGVAAGRAATPNRSPPNGAVIVTAPRLLGRSPSLLRLALWVWLLAPDRCGRYSRGRYSCGRYSWCRYSCGRYSWCRCSCRGVVPRAQFIQRGVRKPAPAYGAASPSSSSMRSSWLYLERRSERQGAPVLICPVQRPTARSAM